MAWNGWIVAALGFMLSIGLGAQPFVSVNLNGQLGNQLFQIATAYAHSRDLGWKFSVPDLTTKNWWNIQENHRKFLFRVPCSPCPQGPVYHDKDEFHCHALPAWPNMVLNGFFQSEGYFARYRSEILELFAFQEGHWERLLETYPALAEPCKIGVQVRINHHPTWDTASFHPTFGGEYYRRAFSTLPEDALYVVVTNHVGGAKNLLRGIDRRLLFLPDTDRFDDLLILSKCDHVVSSNSSFGWWGAWLGDRPGRRCIFPFPYYATKQTRADLPDQIPERWEVIECPEAANYVDDPTLDRSSYDSADARYK